MAVQRLIDADKLKQNLNGSIAPYWIYPSVTKVVDEQPTIDAVKVVRCKDCKLRYSSEYCECRPDDFYCGDGDRKDGDTNEAD